MTDTQHAAPAQCRLDIRLPGDWIAIDFNLLAQWREHKSEVLQPGLSRALELLEASAAAFRSERAVLAAVLAQRGSTEALATLACFQVGLPPLPDGLELRERVRAHPPTDAVEGTFEVDADAAAGGALRARCLRRTVLELPSTDSVSLSVEYFLPVPGSGSMIVAAFSTPNAAREEEYVALFSAIAASIELT